MPSIGTAKINSAFGATVPAAPSKPAMATAIENPGALPATPIMMDSKNDNEPAFNSAIYFCPCLLPHADSILTAFILQHVLACRPVSLTARTDPAGGRGTRPRRRGYGQSHRGRRWR